MKSATFQFTVVASNQSGSDWDLCLYQALPKKVPNGTQALAWMAQKVRYGTQVYFQWAETYDFVWSNDCALATGGVMVASQILSADPYGINQVTLTTTGGWVFTDPIANPQTNGSLVIREDATVPADQGSVGIGMDGTAIYAVPTRPSVTNAFTPVPAYRVAFGDIEVGQVLEEFLIADQSADVVFPANIYAMKATLDQFNTWSLEPLCFSNSQNFFRRSAQRLTKVLKNSKPAAGKNAMTSLSLLRVGAILQGARLYGPGQVLIIQAGANQQAPIAPAQPIPVVAGNPTAATAMTVNLPGSGLSWYLWQAADNNNIYYAPPGQPRVVIHPPANPCTLEVVVSSGTAHLALT